MKISENRIFCQATRLSKLGIFKWVIFCRVFGKKPLDIMKDNYFEKNFWKKSHSNIYADHIVHYIYYISIMVNYISFSQDVLHI